MLYNPAQMDKEELYDTFVAREKLLMELLETIDENTKKKSIQHIILLGARGIGKTHMLRMVENKVFDMPKLQSNWIPVNVPEEQYGIFGLMDFFEYILKIIFHSSKLEKVDRNMYLKELEEIGLNKNKASLDKIVSIFKDIAQKENKQFLLLIDNIDKILAEKITEEKELEYLRSILMTEIFLMFIGTSTSIFEEIALYDKAFFRFFKTIHLQNLNNNEVEELLLKRAEFDKITDKIKLDENKNKIKAITDLTGGYPRLILMLYEILEDKPLLDVLKTFNKLLDNLTPYYKHRMDDLAPQQQKIIDTIMLSDGVASPTDIANIIGWKPTIVTSQFKRLKDLNILKIKESQEKSKKKTVYEISDRLFVIWYQMRYMGVIRRRIEYIVTFLKIWYDLAELKDKISSYASKYQQNYSRGNFSESYSYAKSISIMSCAISEVSEKQKIIYEQVNRYINVGKFEDALNDLQDLLKKHEESNDQKGIAYDHSNIGYVFGKQGDSQKSIQHCEKAMKIYEEMNNRDGIAHNLCNMGNAFQIKGDLQKSIEYYEKALKIHEEIGTMEGIASNSCNMGSVFQKQGDLQKSLEYYEKALKINEEMRNKEGMAINLGNMGTVFLKQGELQKSIEYYEKALKMHEEMGTMDGIATDLGNMGTVFQIQGELQKSLEHYEKALKIHEEMGNMQGMANQFANMGIVFQIHGDLQKSLEYYEKALKIHDEKENKQGMANQFANMGTLFQKQGELQKSLQHYEKALKIYKEIGEKLNYNITNNNKINLLLKYAITQNKEKNAGKALENLEEIVESLKETKNEDTMKIIVPGIFELLKDSEYDFAITIMEILKKKHTDIFEICEPFMISAKYLKTNDESIFENTSSIVLEGVKKILKAVEKPSNEKS